MGSLDSDSGIGAARGVEQPERQLWCAVIHRAAHDALACVSAATGEPERGRSRQEARRWFELNGDDFRQVCLAAGWDPDYVRGRVLKRIQAAGEPGLLSPAAIP